MLQEVKSRLVAEDLSNWKIGLYSSISTFSPPSKVPSEGENHLLLVVSFPFQQTADSLILFLLLQQQSRYNFDHQIWNNLISVGFSSLASSLLI